MQAAPVDEQADNIETKATKQINEWQAQYEQYIEATVKTRQTGCTADNIVERQEWSVSVHQERWKPENVLTWCIGEPSQNMPGGTISELSNA